MTYTQLKKLSDLHEAGWKAIADPNAKSNDLVCGGPAYIQHPDGRIFVVHSDGSLEEHV